MENLEQIMRKIHVLFAKCEPYGNEADNRIIVPKKEVFRLLEQLNYEVISMMDRYEGTAESRERGLADYRRSGELLVEQAQAGADDVYAASLIYMDNEIEELESVLAGAKENLWEDYARMAGRIDEQLRTLTENQEEIRQQLIAMAQGDKYLRLIKRENARLKRLEEQLRMQEEEDEEDEDSELNGEFESGDDEEFEYDGEDSGEPENGDEGDGEFAGQEDVNPQPSGEGSVPGDAMPRESKDAEGKGENPGAVGEDFRVDITDFLSDEEKLAYGESADSPESGPDAAPTGGSGTGAATKKKPSGKKTGTGKPKKKAVPKHPRLVPDLEAEWAAEGEQRPVRNVGAALYEDVGQPYDPPAKKVSYEIKVNQAYFEQLGEGAVDLDAEYYEWKAQQEAIARGESAEGSDVPAANEEGKSKEEADLKEESGGLFGRKKEGKDKKNHRTKFGKRKG